MSLEANIILSLLDVQLWMVPHSNNIRIKEKKQKLKPAPCLNKYTSVNKRKLYKSSEQK
ncbi:MULTISPECIES: hypothetical protein [Bacillus cereus group]|jgi:hypothetical protein|nr:MULTISPECIES: hypothetical protein [Bacillus cereus group]EEL33476.1 hypothetical protein bcere0019_32860 [Bacillus cereus Rock3-28]EJR57060.1 hypothetical protein IIO_05140 [Bacillus cereus VD115]PKR94324.1 hypothetical protein bcere0024_020930 [Bacillus cereus Rock4-18]MBJ7932835.1 hypothetical protein [Bacillus cereus group sp. N31]MBJ7950082.1 hypothetical protein [Bacillus cereus group sp. N24]